jgi:4-hydroxythreonine-4-phosphate dehydrogenase
MKNIAIIAGEPNSINSEIIAKAWRFTRYKKNIFIIGNYSLIKNQLKKINIKIKLEVTDNPCKKKSSDKLQILNVPLSFKNSFNVKSESSSKYVLRCLDMANDLARKKIINGFINCAIDKKRTFKVKNMGVTDYLAKKNKIQNSVVMLIYNKSLAVVPITTHISVKNISKNLSIKLIENKIVTLNKFYLQKFRKKPIIALMGLNPHNDEFRNTSEEHKIILPAIKKLRKRKIKIMGPFPADTIFSNQKKYNYDVVVGMYHDQVLAPFKAIYNYNAINITLGLNYLRISPDHGTALDIVGKKRANPLSLVMAINFFLKN